MIQKIKQCFNNIKYRSKLILLCILVSFLPLSVMGFFCYNQTINLLRTRELDSLESSILSVSNSLDSKVNTYQNLLAYLANSNVLAEFSSYNETNAYDQYEYLNYTMDVFLNTTYLQHPEISQIDRVLRDTLRKTCADATRFIVAQRIGTIRDADKIIVLDDGKIAGMGKHNELMETCEVYRQIAYSQLSKEELA